MKVFISSTCYDLIDLRAELYEDLRDLGIDPLFSDIKESDFQLSTDAATNSIENCLVNVRAAAVVVVVLSQRYGPLLGDAYDNLSATHCEYREAKGKKPIHFYVRSQLAGEWSGWKKNGRQDSYRTAWAKDSDAIHLFRFIDEHQLLLAPHGQPANNNWFWHFNSSVDLRSDIRRRLAPQAYQASAEKLINSGDVPLIMSTGGAGQTCGGNFSTPAGRLTIEFNIANIGRNPALSPTAQLLCAGQQYKPVSSLPVLLPGGPNHKVAFEIPSLPLVKALEPSPNQSHVTLAVKYISPQGYEFEDLLSFAFQRAPDGRPQPLPVAPVFGKRIIGMKSLILNS